MTHGSVTTARLRLRALAAGDLALFRDLYCDAEVMRFIGRPLTPEHAAASFRATLDAMRQPLAPRFFAVIEKQGGRGIGICAMQAPATRERSVEIGIMLRRDARRRQYAREALSALMAVALRTLPIDTVWVQYRRANRGAARLFDALEFSEVDGWRPCGARPRLCVRVLRRPTWRIRQTKPDRGVPMSSVIGFLENIGRNAAMRHASRERLLQEMQREGIAPELRSALLRRERLPLDGLLGVRDTMYLQNHSVQPPKIAPPKKKPAKAPPKKTPAKKTPAKKPAKKAPAKRGGKR